MWCLCKHPLHVSSDSLLLSRRILVPSYTNLIDTQLHSSMCLISGCRRSTPVLLLPVLSNVAPPSLRRKASSDKMLQIIEAHQNWPVFADVFEHSSACLLMPNLARHDTCQHNCAVERVPGVGFCGQLHHCNWPYYPAAWFRSSSSVLVSAEPFSDRSRPMPCNSSLMGPCHITDMWLASSRLWAISFIDKLDGRLQLLHEVEDDAVKWLESIATTVFVKWNLAFRHLQWN